MLVHYLVNVKSKYKVYAMNDFISSSNTSQLHLNKCALCSLGVFKMMSVSCSAGLQSLTPFPDYSVNNTLIKTVPLLLSALPQLFHILDLVFTARCYAPAVLAMALCLSVRPSITSRSSAKTAKRKITQTTPHDCPGTLVF